MYSIGSKINRGGIGIVLKLPNHAGIAANYGRHASKRRSGKRFRCSIEKLFHHGSGEVWIGFTGSCVQTIYFSQSATGTTKRPRQLCV